jgi:hypothetical protein
MKLVEGYDEMLKDIQNGVYDSWRAQRGRVVMSGAEVNTSLVEECIILDAEIATLKEQCRDYYKARANMKAINEELLLQNTQLTEKLNFSTQLVESLTNLVTCQHAAAEKRDQPEPDTSLIK